MTSLVERTREFLNSPSVPNEVLSKEQARRVMANSSDGRGYNALEDRTFSLQEFAPRRSTGPLLVANRFDKDEHHITPLHQVGEERFEAFRTAVHSALVKLLPEVNWDSMLADPRRVAYPAIYTAYDSRANSRYNELASDWPSELFRENCMTILNTCYRWYTTARPVAYEGTYFGLPSGARTKAEKLSIMRSLSTHYDAILALVTAGKLEECARKYGVLALDTRGSRLQAEGLKSRPTYPPEIALTQGVLDDPSWPEQVDKDRSVTRGLHASRHRWYVQSAGALNYLVQLSLGRYNRAFFKANPETFYVSTVDYISAALDACFQRFGSEGVRVFDAPQYDNLSRPRFFVAADYEVAMRALGRHFPLYKLLLSRAHVLRGVTYDPDPGGYSRGTYIMGDPLDPYYNAMLDNTMSSGDENTASYPRRHVACQHLAWFAEVHRHKLTQEEVMAWMRHDPSVFSQFGGCMSLIQGDDNVMATTPRTWDKIDALGPRYNLLILESGDEPFKGYEVMRPGTIKYGREYKRACAEYNLLTLVNKIFWQEREYTHPARANYRIGMAARLQVYAEHPMYERVMTIVDEAHTKFYGMTYRAYVSANAQLVAAGSINANTARLELLDDPTKFQWKYDAEEAPDLYAAFAEDAPMPSFAKQPMDHGVYVDPSELTSLIESSAYHTKKGV